MIFDFKTDAKSHAYFTAIAEEMIRQFGITEEEAIGRINREWRGQEIIGEDRMIYHEDEEYWAKTVYYGKDSYWWTNPKDLRPLPYP